MNLLSLLMQSMTSSSSVSAVSGSTGASGKQVKNLMTLALPILLKYLTKNAGSAGGAASLLSALGQHKNQKSMAEQLAGADTADGGKILAHILGGDQSAVFGQLASQTGMSSAQVSQALGSMAPALMSGLSAAADETASGKNDLAGLASVFGTQQPSGLSGLMSSWLNSKKKKPQTSAGNDGTELLSILSALMK